MIRTARIRYLARMKPSPTTIEIADRLLALGAISARRHRIFVAGDQLTFDERMAACDFTAPASDEITEWLADAPVGTEFL